MTREQAIQHIQNLFPVDSENPGTAEAGRELLERARAEAMTDWRNESDAVLVRYAQLCIEEERRNAGL